MGVAELSLWAWSAPATRRGRSRSVLTGAFFYRRDACGHVTAGARSATATVTKRLSTGTARCTGVHSTPWRAGRGSGAPTYVLGMRDEAGARMRKYLRVAYEGGAEPEPAPRAPSRWAAPTGAATRIAAVLLVLVVAAITYFVMVRIAPAPAAPAAPSAEPSVPTMPEPTTTSGEGPLESAPPSDGVLVVHVAGAVLDPGLVELVPGSRVAEAIELAGGATDEADLDALNLAAPVADGQQVYVPREGEAVPPATDGSGGAEPGAPGEALVNINTADAAGLETLPGIGPALAERIVSWRNENGPFPSVDALTNVSGIGPATLARLRDLVTV